MKWLSSFKSKGAQEGGEVQRSSVSGSTQGSAQTGAMSRSGSTQQGVQKSASHRHHFLSPHKHTKPIPNILECSYRGDVAGVLAAITRGEDVNQMVDMDNKGGRSLRAVTPLFLAAQKNRSEVVKLLVENGADPTHRVYFSDSKEHCTPAQVATLNLNLVSAMYLSRAASRYGKGEGLSAGKRTASVEPQDAPFSPENYNTLSGASVTLGPDEPGRPMPGFGNRNVHDNPMQLRPDGDLDVERHPEPSADDHIPENSSEASEFLQTYEHEPEPDQGVQRTSKSFYFNLGFGMSRRTEDGIGGSHRWEEGAEMRKTEDGQQQNEGMDLNVKGLNSRAEHLRSLLSQPAYE